MEPSATPWRDDDDDEDYEEHGGVHPRHRKKIIASRHPLRLQLPWPLSS